MNWLSLSLILFAFSAKGQLNQIWADVNLQHGINKKWSVIGDAGARYTIDHSLSVAFARGGVVYQVSPIFKLYGGLAYFHYKTPVSGAKGNEIRPWQGIRLDVNLGKSVVLSNYTRLEERFIHSQGSDNFYLRFRNLTGLSFIVYNNKEKNKSIYLPISFEFFEDLNKKLFVNRYRIYLGAGHAFSKNKIELHYILQNGRVHANEDIELTENVYRLRWFRAI
jgi:hypothetical protein